jgi:hypothetical protein
MEFQEVLQIIGSVLVVILGYLSLYMKKRGDLVSMVTTAIAYAEDKYKATGAGGEKFEWVVDKLYSGIPAYLRPMISRKDVEKLVQSTFDEIEKYADMQLNGFVDKFVDEIYNSAAD